MLTPFILDTGKTGTLENSDDPKGGISSGSTLFAKIKTIF